MEFVQTLIDQYITDPRFVTDMVITFFILDALQEIKKLDALGNQYKKLSSLVIGTLLGPLLIEPSVYGFTAGLLAGGALTLGLDRINIIADRIAGKPEPVDPQV